ncbi:polyketide synthase Pks13 [Corynebacterium cystitidis]|uniref:polyketide synthase Pks13 n=1 Tax=Corynebacterium cystitidis TaxID=35757 RepID=UPI00211EB4D3|nr:polyketide synthase Pks13 [Corynebacterium cystitidis]
MTEQELAEWILNWVSQATSVPVAELDVNKPLESFGLASRDAVVLSGELENLLGRQLDPTIAYEHPTIAALADYLINGRDHDQPRAIVREYARTTAESPQARDIAIIGRAGRFPQADTVDEFWSMLVEGRTATGPLPTGRWAEYSADPVMGKKIAEQNTTGGYFDDIASFDNEFFGLSPVEAENMDPQQRLALELTWQALEDAHLPANRLRGESVGVFLGSSNFDYGMLVTSDPAEAHPYALTGTSSAIIPNRVSYAFDFRGPSVNVDTACSSSLVAVHHAVRALRDGEADVAVAGGVNIMSNPFVSTAFGELGVISPTGAIHAFSDDADGFVRADAAGVLILKRVEDALADGDTILGVIKGTATNSDGHSNGLTAPNPEAQVDVLRRAYADADVDPTTVDYVEAHGTGTILGDPIEATALGEVLGTEREMKHPTLLGSAKSNIGHSESAAGAVALIKVIEALNHDIIPPSANFTAPNRYIDFDAQRLEVVEDAREWPKYSGRRIAGVSGFGFGGTNAHIVVTDFDPSDYSDVASSVADTDDSTGERTIFSGERTIFSGERTIFSGERTIFSGERTCELTALPVSGLLPSRRKAAAAALADFLEGRADEDLVPVARSLAGRNHGRSRAVVQAKSVSEAVTRLRQVADGKVSVGIAAADSPSTAGPVFVYSGFGSQHRKMVKKLIEVSPFFRQRMEELDKHVECEAGWSMLDIVRDDEQTYDTNTAQVTITAIQIAVTDLLAELGITPAAVAGMSMGEIAAAYTAGGISDADAMRIACHRARLMGEGEEMTADTPQEGAMAVVELTREELAEFVEKHEDAAGIEPAVYAGPGMTTVGGPVAAVDYLVAALEQEGKFARKMRVRGAGHTSALDPIMGELGFEIAGVKATPLQIPLFSSVERGHVFQPGEVVHDDQYFLTMTRQPVYFQDAIEKAFEAGHTTLVEVCPNPVAIMGMMNTAFAAGKPDAQLLYTMKRKEDEVESLIDLAAKLYVRGQDVDWTKIYGVGDVIPSPFTQFKKVKHWTKARPSSGGPSAGLPGVRVALPDGKTAFGAQADQVFSPHQLIEAAADVVAPGSRVVATEERGTLPATGDVTTLVESTLGGVSIKVFAADSVVAEGFATTLALDSPQTVPGVAEITPTSEFAAVGGDANIEQIRWDPNSGETVEERLRAIVSESMGYDVDDLPLELPLIDLGLDSLMGMRIKNRVENDFQIPPLNVQALRDASVADVIHMVSSQVRTPEESVTSQVRTPEESVTSQVRSPGEGVSAGVGVAPRDASERMVFGAWAKYTGAAAAGVTSELPEIDDEQATNIAAHLTERSGTEITADDVRGAETLEPLANMVREGLETEVEGNIRVFRDPDVADTAVFMFHPAGATTVVYEPLSRRLTENAALFGVERLEGSLDERAAAYVDDIVKYAGGRKVVLGGWSFGGALAFEVASQLRQREDCPKIEFIALLDTTQPREPIPDTMEETKARWQRYADFAKDTYGLEFEVPFDLLEAAGEEALMGMLEHLLATTDASEHGLAAGVLEHQRASFVDNQILGKIDFQRWADVDVPVLLFRSERMHDGAITLEPRYADIAEDGNWGKIVDNLTIVQCPGDHLAMPDEPVIGIVGKHINEWIERLK